MQQSNTFDIYQFTKSQVTGWQRYQLLLCCTAHFVLSSIGAISVKINTQHRKWSHVLFYTEFFFGILYIFYLVFSALPSVIVYSTARRCDQKSILSKLQHCEMEQNITQTTRKALANQQMLSFINIYSIYAYLHIVANTNIHGYVQYAANKIRTAASWWLPVDTSVTGMPKFPTPASCLSFGNATTENNHNEELGVKHQHFISEMGNTTSISRTNWIQWI